MRVLAAAAAAFLLSASAAFAQEQPQPDPVETKLVNQAQAAQTTQQNFLEAVRALVEARSREKATSEAERAYWTKYVAGLAAPAKP